MGFTLVMHQKIRNKKFLALAEDGKHFVNGFKKMLWIFLGHVLENPSQNPLLKEKTKPHFCGHFVMDLRDCAMDFSLEKHWQINRKILG